MKPARFLIAALILLVPVTFLATSARPRPTPAEDEVRDLEQRVNAAYEANDLPKYFSFYAPDFLQFLPEGRTDFDAYKKEWTAYIGEGNRVEKVDISDLHIQVGPNKDAVASYILHVRAESKAERPPKRITRNRTCSSSGMGSGRSCSCIILPYRRSNRQPTKLK